jgi:acetylornithine deacetylase/succinyl-diaminopimelate desuccinylase-like protein
MTRTGRLLATFGAALSCAAVHPAAAQPGTRQSARPDRSASIEAEARAILAEMVSANTTAGTGATTPLALKLAARLRAAGFPASDVMVEGATPRNRNVVVRWRGSTREKPIVINAHIDVVEAPRLGWSSDPFSLTEREGFLYGRGVIDNKGPAAAALTALLELRRQGVVPRRDILLTLTAGEESGVDNGVEWLLGNRRALIDAEYVVSLDAGGARMEDGRVRAFEVQSAEKVYLDLELVARGPGGHSSVPSGASPIDRLARAVDRMSRHAFPVSVSPVMRLYLERGAALRTGDIGAAMAALAGEPGDLGAQFVLLQEPVFNALLRTTCIATMLRGGTAPNVIPQEVAATVNCRLLPGETQEATIRTLHDVIADSTITIRTLVAAIPSEPSIPSAAFLAMIERVVGAEHPGVPAVPYMETGATDGLYFRNAGMPTFGVQGAFIEDAEFQRVHGVDERISVGAFRAMLRYSERLLRELAGS